MSAERKIFLFFLTNEIGQSYFYDSGTAKLSNQPLPLSNSPQGWFDQQLTFGRNAKYFGLNRSYTQPLKFVEDGALIIRNLLYLRAGIQQPLRLIVLKWNDATDIYELYYRGEIDLSKVQDNAAESVTVNVMEGGVAKIIKNYESTTFEIPLDGSIPENFTLKINGILFNATFSYSLAPCGLTSYITVLPIVFLNEQGNDVGCVKTSQDFAQFGNGDFSSFATSGNYLFSSINQIAVTVTGTVQFTAGISNGNLFIYTSKGRKVDLIPSGPISSSQIYQLNGTITLAGGENLFILFQSTLGNPNSGINISQIYITFNSQFKDTDTVCIRPYDLLKLLLQKINALESTPLHNVNYQVESILLDQYSNLALTSGMALRNEAGAVLKTSMGEFFDSFNAVLGGAMGNGSNDEGVSEFLFFEHKNYCFDPSVITMQLGEVQGLTISPAMDQYFNTLKIGYPEQKYDEATGNQEYNTTAQYTTPITKIKKELSLISKYRGDSFGMEYTRFLIGTSNSANNKSDNAVFIVNVDFTSSTGVQATVSNTVTQVIKPLGNSPTLTPINNGVITGGPEAANFNVKSIAGINDLIQYVNSIPATLGITVVIKGTFIGTVVFGNDPLIQGFNNIFNHPYNVTFTLIVNGVATPVTKTITMMEGKDFQVSFYIQQSFGFGGSFYVKMMADPNNYSGFVANVDSVVWSITDPSEPPIYGLKRIPYQAITGINNGQFAYNIEDMTPARMLQKHGDFIRSSLFNHGGEDLKFQVLDKNSSLSTQYSATNTITEGGDIPIGSLNPKLLFYPFVFEFKTSVPVNFADIMTGAANGHIQFTFNGKTFYGYPIEVSAKPAINESQSWKLLCSPATNLADLQDLNIDGLNYINLMGLATFISHLNPVQFVPLNSVLPAQYHFEHMDADWFANQVAFWSQQAQYYQKFQTNDTISIQCQTSGLGPVQLQLIACSGQIMQTITLSQVTDPAVVSPNALFQGTVSLTGLAEGIYYLLLNAGTGSTITQFISEPIYVKASWSKTLLFEYTNSRNKQSTVFSSGFSPAFRIEGWLDNYKPEAKFAVYEDEPADIQMLNGIPYRAFKLNIGDNQGVPPWVIDKINRIMLLNNVKIDGLAFSRNADAKFEEINVPGWPMKYWSLEVRESANRDGMTVDTTGALDANLTVVYNIDTKAFGDGDGQGGSGVVQVTKVD